MKRQEDAEENQSGVINLKAIKKGYCIRLTNKDERCKKKDRVRFLSPIDGDIYVSEKQAMKQFESAKKYYGAKYEVELVRAKVSVGDEPVC